MDEDTQTIEIAPGGYAEARHPDGDHTIEITNESPYRLVFEVDGDTQSDYITVKAPQRVMKVGWA